MYWITPDGSYYEGDQAHPIDAAVPQRPDPTFDWNSGQNAWVQNAVRAALVAAVAQVVTDATAVKTAAIVQQLMNATDAQIVTFVANHSTADAGTQALIVLLARICRILLLRGAVQ